MIPAYTGQLAAIQFCPNLVYFCLILFKKLPPKYIFCRQKKERNSDNIYFNRLFKAVLSLRALGSK